MQHPLMILWKTFFDICRFRRAPQDLPHSSALLSVTIMISLGIDIGVSLLEIPFDQAVLVALLNVGIVYGMVSILLFILRYPQRRVQTLCALFGTDSVITVLSIPPVIWIFQADAANLDMTLPLLLVLALGGWNLAIIAHILRHALSVSLGMGFMLAIMLAISSFSLSYHLFPPQKAETQHQTSQQIP